MICPTIRRTTHWSRTHKSFAEAVTLAEGDNLFEVKADVKAEAEEGQTIDAKVVSVHVGTADVEAAAGDPEGARTLKNMVMMTAGDHGTVQLGLGKTMMIYDDGGADGDGADGVQATLVLSPTGDADCVKLTNQGISFSYTAHLRIYKLLCLQREKLPLSAGCALEKVSL